MMRKHDGGRQSVSVLASCVVIFLGGMACLLVVMISSPNPNEPLAYVGGGAFALLFLVWWFNRPVDRERPIMDWLHWKLYGPQTRKKEEFKVKLMKPPVDDWTPRRPPTVEEIREMKRESLNSWIPSEERKGSKRKSGE